TRTRAPAGCRRARSSATSATPATPGARPTSTSRSTQAAGPPSTPTPTSPPSADLAAGAATDLDILRQERTGRRARDPPQGRRRLGGGAGEDADPSGRSGRERARGPGRGGAPPPHPPGGGRPPRRAGPPPPPA